MHFLPEKYFYTQCDASSHKAIIIFKIAVFQNPKKGQNIIFPDLELNPGPKAC